ncbi:Septum formation inhibitor-activating ATPase [Leclercia adecarboxylata]|uniref:Septum formation inhibitor-activating ATPase n=1 Tax=Leclercia adecarboxylata TaxID=83655 RepID=A0A4U9HYR1_9ENTR|nr:Septum formation inhibitor-activating ATPase [Leclercia adecarboxylata]
METGSVEVANDMIDTNKKYLIWNNKGGVGKTFLTYNIAVEYAIAHDNEDVVVIDACPQSKCF